MLACGHFPVESQRCVEATLMSNASDTNAEDIKTVEVWLAETKCRQCQITFDTLSYTEISQQNVESDVMPIGMGDLVNFASGKRRLLF